jgi:DNA helicase HerA-like ATPase
MLAAALLRKLYEAREAAASGEDDAIEHPVFSLFEEGHRFAPDGKARSLGILRRILSEGRKFGFGVGIIGQRPSKIRSRRVVPVRHTDHHADSEPERPIGDPNVGRKRR